MGRTTRRPALVIVALVAGLVLVPATTATTAAAHEGHGHAVPSLIAAAAQEAVATATLPAGFADVQAIGHISEATAVAFAPDGTAFVALKTGVIKSFDYDSASDTFEDWTQSTTFADLSDNVDNYWDRGLTGIAVDPQFGTAGHNFVYVSYTYNRDPRDNPPVVPKWGPPGQQYDDCAQPATTSPPTAGCVVMDRVTRLTAVHQAQGWVMSGPEKELLASGCFQFGSHASGDVAFGPDGKLYASAGEGASFDTLDYGQYVNPCGDPTDEGGSLRAQDYRTSGVNDPLGVDGSIVRMDPATGLVPTQGTASTWLVAYGQRNPWRLTFRPKADGTGLTNELWSGDVGASAWEEVNRIPDVTTAGGPVNRGWPCYEGSWTGSLVQDGWNALDKPLCESLYSQGTGAVAAPYFSYQTRGPLLTPGEDCMNDTSSVSGIAFGSANSNYPAAYKGAMFFSDYARSCIWMLGKLPNGDPDPATILPFVQAAETPVELVTGPGGDLYYVDYGLDDQGVPTANAAGVHRIVYTGSNGGPTATIVADQLSGASPLTVAFDATTSTDPDGDPLTYSWDLDGDGTFGDSTAAKPTHVYPVGTYQVGLTVDDGHGHTSTAHQQIQSGNTAPVLGTVTPDASLTWTVGQTISYSAAATDQEDGVLPDSAYSWNVAIRHCPSNVCHTHNLTTLSGPSGSFAAPDHEFPSHLLLTLTVTDSGGLTTSTTIQLDPKTVVLTFDSSPEGATITINGDDLVAPYAGTFIQGSQVTVTAAPTNGSATFGSWSDGGARSHELSAPTTPATYTASYATDPVDTPPTVTRLTAYPDATFYVGQTLGFDAAATDPQQPLADSAYSFVMQRQDCDACARVEVQRWSHVSSGRFDVPALPAAGHLWLVATVVDDQGVVGTRELRLDPQLVNLTVDAKPRRLHVSGSGPLVRGSTVQVRAPRHQLKRGVRWVFVRWSDGGARRHSVTVWDPAVELTAIYKRQR